MDSPAKQKILSDIEAAETQLEELILANAIYQDGAEQSDENKIAIINKSISEEKITFSGVHFKHGQEIDDLEGGLKNDKIAHKATTLTFPQRATDAGYPAPEDGSIPTLTEFYEELTPSVEEAANQAGFSQSVIFEVYLKLLGQVMSIVTAIFVMFSAWSIMHAVTFRHGRMIVQAPTNLIMGVAAGMTVGLAFSAIVNLVWKKIGTLEARAEFKGKPSVDPELGPPTHATNPSRPVPGGVK